MSRRWIAVMTFAVVTGCGSEHSELVALDGFYKSNDPRAKTCAQYAALVGEAYDALGPNDPAELAAKRLEAKYKERISSNEDQARLSRMMGGVSNLAYGLRTLTKEGALIAHMQMCRQQSSGGLPTPSDLAAIDRKLRSAEGCEKNFPAGTQRKDCVARAFGSQT
jgi:hypothetical protein